MTAKPSQIEADSLFALLKYRDAKKIYEALLVIEPANTGYVLQLSFCNMALRNYTDAEKNMENYLAINPHPTGAVSAQLYSNHARIWAVRNDSARGFEFLSKAVDSGYARLDEFDYESDYNTLRSDEKFIFLREKAELNAYPCLTEPKARDFDFMIGDWNVYNNPGTGLGTLAGYNKWERISGGCAILENWTAVGPPHNGKSINYYDPRKKAWEQIWVGSEGVGAIVQRFLNGVYDPKEKIMKFEYDEQRPNGSKINHRFRFFNLDSQTARQLKETSADAGKTWTVNYDYLYKRMK